uniref:Glycosyltransferase family 92 protein n=1 Tax=Acrobeloides nanus TaxID=290746 RepID=A0A914CNG5_9BILA
MPKTDNFDPNKALYQMGHTAIYNDCLMRTKTKFMALVDLDEIILPQHWITTPKYFPLDRPPKPIEITDGIIIILTHKVDSHQWPYHEKNVTYDEAVYYRTTNNYTSLKE